MNNKRYALINSRFAGDEVVVPEGFVDQLRETFSVLGMIEDVDYAILVGGAEIIPIDYNIEELRELEELESLLTFKPNAEH